MDYKQKYEQLEKFIKDLYPFMSDYCKEKTEGMISELKESEDERIRKEIVEIFKDAQRDGICEPIREEQFEQIFAWLEKQGEQKIGPAPIFKIGDILKRKCKDYTFRVDRIQGGYYHCDRNHGAFFPIEEQGNWELVEQNPADKVEPKFKVGDWINRDDAIWRIEGVRGKEYILGGRPDVVILEPIHIIDSEFRLWTIQDAKDGDVLCYKDEISLYKHDIKNCTKQETTFGGFVYYCCYDGKRFITDSLYSLTEQDKTNIHPATKEQRDLFFQKMKEAGYEWDSEKKELKKIKQEQTELPNGEDYGIDSLYHAARILEKTLGDVDGYQSDDGILEHKCAIEAVNRLYKQKPAWSEEDKNMLQNILECLKNGWSKLPTDILKYESWLKSLKERVQSQSKQEWSEEEKARIDKIIDVLDWAEEKGHIRYSDWEDYVCYVKSLKPQNTWKPSAEQMKFLWRYAEQNNYDGSILTSLYNDLKKLREE